MHIYLWSLLLDCLLWVVVVFHVLFLNNSQELCRERSAQGTACNSFQKLHVQLQWAKTSTKLLCTFSATPGQKLTWKSPADKKNVTLHLQQKTFIVSGREHPQKVPRPPGTGAGPAPLCRQPQPDAFCCAHLRLLVVPALYRSWLIPHLVSPLFLLFFPAGRARGRGAAAPPAASPPREGRTSPGDADYPPGAHFRPQIKVQPALPPPLRGWRPRNNTPTQLPDPKTRT